MASDRWPPPPRAPEPEHCCGRGCSPCIFDYYDAAFAEWAELVRKSGSSPEEALASFGEQRAQRPY